MFGQEDKFVYFLMKTFQKDGIMLLSNKAREDLFFISKDLLYISQTATNF